MNKEYLKEINKINRLIISIENCEDKIWQVKNAFAVNITCEVVNPSNISVGNNKANSKEFDCDTFQLTPDSTNKAREFILKELNLELERCITELKRYRISRNEVVLVYSANQVYDYSVVHSDIMKLIDRSIHLKNTLNKLNIDEIDIRAANDDYPIQSCGLAISLSSKNKAIELIINDIKAEIEEVENKLASYKIEKQ